MVWFLVLSRTKLSYPSLRSTPSTLEPPELNPLECADPTNPPVTAFRMNRSEILRLKVLWNEQIQEKWGGRGAMSLHSLRPKSRTRLRSVGASFGTRLGVRLSVRRQPRSGRGASMANTSALTLSREQSIAAQRKAVIAR